MAVHYLDPNERAYEATLDRLIAARDAIRVQITPPEDTRTMDQFDNKTAFLSGGAGGIGRALAGTFLDAGMNVVLADLDREKLGQFARGPRRTRTGPGGRPRRDQPGLMEPGRR